MRERLGQTTGLTPADIAAATAAGADADDGDGESRAEDEIDWSPDSAAGWGKNGSSAEGASGIIGVASLDA